MADIPSLGMKPILILDGAYTEKRAQDSDDNDQYIGIAKPGTASSDALWQIRRYTYSASDKITAIEWASGNDLFDKVWDNRATYTYNFDTGADFSAYSVFNVTTDTSYDADSTSLDELANVLGTLITLFKTGTTVTSSFTVTNVTTDHSFDATSTSLDELADVLGSIIASLAATGSSTDVYTPTNVTTDISFDATSTSIDEVANVIGSVIATLQGAGKLL